MRGAQESSGRCGLWPRRSIPASGLTLARSCRSAAVQASSPPASASPNTKSRLKSPREGPRRLGPGARRGSCGNSRVKHRVKDRGPTPRAAPPRPAAPPCPPHLLILGVARFGVHGHHVALGDGAHQAQALQRGHGPEPEPAGHACAEPGRARWAEPRLPPPRTAGKGNRNRPCRGRTSGRAVCFPSLRLPSPSLRFPLPREPERGETPFRGLSAGEDGRGRAGLSGNWKVKLCGGREREALVGVGADPGCAGSAAHIARLRPQESRGPQRCPRPREPEHTRSSPGRAMDGPGHDPHARRARGGARGEGNAGLGVVRVQGGPLLPCLCTAKFSLRAVSTLPCLP